VRTDEGLAPRRFSSQNFYVPGVIYELLKLNFGSDPNRDGDQEIFKAQINHLAN